MIIGPLLFNPCAFLADYQDGEARRAYHLRLLSCGSSGLMLPDFGPVLWFD